MTINQESKREASVPQTLGAEAPRGISRRRFVNGASGATGVLLAVQAKTALGQAVCQSPSAMVSGNQSPRPDEGPASCSGGYSPGFWKQPQKFEYWINAIPPMFKNYSTYCPDIQGQGKLPEIIVQGTMADTILNGAPQGASVWLVIANPTDYPDGELMRHLLAAWLNIGFLGALYPIDGNTIKAMWWGTRNGGSSYYPYGATTGWDAGDVVDYIKGMYDLQTAGIEPPTVCAADTAATSTTTTTTTGDTSGGTTTGGKGTNKNK